MEYKSTSQGSYNRVLATPIPGDRANGSSPWFVEVVLDNGETVEAESLYLPEIGATLCIAVYDNGRWGNKFIAIGDVAVMTSQGLACNDWTPARRN